MAKKILPNYKHELKIVAEFRPGFLFMKSFSFLSPHEQEEYAFSTAKEYLEALDDEIPKTCVASLPVFVDYEREIPLSTQLGTYELGFTISIIIFAKDITDLLHDAQKTIECIRKVAKDKLTEIYNIYVQEPSSAILLESRKDAYTTREVLEQKLTFYKQSLHHDEQ